MLRPKRLLADRERALEQRFGFIHAPERLIDGGEQDERRGDVRMIPAVAVGNEIDVMLGKRERVLVLTGPMQLQDLGLGRVESVGPLPFAPDRARPRQWRLGVGGAPLRLVETGKIPK